MSFIEDLEKRIEVSRGNKPADLVIKNAFVLNVFLEKFEKTDVAICDGYIVGTGNYQGKKEVDATGKYLVPGFIDSHVHLESSIVTPFQYANVVSKHGTTAVVCDPHEITNVLGMDGVEYMLKSSEGLPIDVYVMAPSCVPATPFDENGATINAKEICKIFNSPRVLGLAEMMNYVGVINSDKEVLKKLDVTKSNNKIADGHAPLLCGKDLNAYITAGIKSDHECTNFIEAQEKLAKGQWIMIRQGTSCKNLKGLANLIKKPYCDRCMFATDDKHISELKDEGHIDYIIRQAISGGADPILAYKMASYNTATYFGLKEMGAVACGYKADFVILNDLEKVEIDSVYKSGVEIAELAQPPVISKELQKQVCNSIHLSKVSEDSFKLNNEKTPVIGVVKGEILTTNEGLECGVDTSKDICKIAVVERHKKTGHIGVALLKGYGLKRGAIATSIAHDSHNIIVAGVDDKDIALAVNTIIKLQGGMVVVNNGEVLSELALSIAGLMCDRQEKEVSTALNQLKLSARELGIEEGIDPFMTLSFVSLPVIPSLRLLTQGVFDVEQFKLI